MPNSFSQPSQPRLVDWSRLRAELLWAYCGPPIMPQAEHRYEYPVLMCWLILQGQVQAFSPGSGSIKAKAGDWLFMPDDKQGHTFSEDAKIISLRLIVQWPNQQHLYDHNQWIRFADAEYPQLQKQSWNLVRRAYAILKSKPAEVMSTDMITLPCNLAQYLQLEQAVLKWVEIYDRTMQKLQIKRSVMVQPDKRVAQCLRYIEQLPPNREFDEKQLARSLGLSAGRMNRLFSQHIHMTPKAYAGKLRVNDAIKLLTTTNLPIKELTYRLGFKQQSHFANWFWKRTGYYPTDYRQSFKKPSMAQIIETIKSG